MAQRHGLHIGVCIRADPLRNDPRYAETAAREFSMVTTENALKFESVCPSPDVFNFDDADDIVRFAEVNGMAVRGHVLVWYSQLPEWLLEGEFDAAELTRIMTGYIEIVVGRYAGRIGVWDVVNEAIAEDGSFRESLWHSKIGPGYIRTAFHAARRADPKALLFYNDFGIESTLQHSESTYRLVRDLLREDTPIDGVGLQMHLDIGHLDQMHQLAPALERFATLGLRVHVTELDVRIPLNGRPSAQQLADQASVYRHVLRACMDTPQCEVFALWGFIDRHSWIPDFYPEEGAALIYDDNYRKKPSYKALAAELRGSRLSNG